MPNDAPKPPSITPLVDAALAEDVGPGDATTLATVPADATAEAEIRAREAGVICGLGVAALVFNRVDPGVAFDPVAFDGERIAAGAVVARLRGPARGILTAERTALNFLQHLSGIATATARAVEALGGSGTRILDTRKTLPGMRTLAKYAVRCGGGENHRQGLFDMILIKENHVAAAGGIVPAITRAREARPDLRIEVEVRDLDELEEALPASPDRVMLDNFPPERVREAMERLERRRAGHGSRPEVEISGGMTPEVLGAYAGTGVDYISSGALTHSVRALDLSLIITSGRAAAGAPPAGGR